VGVGVGDNFRRPSGTWRRVNLSTVVPPIFGGSDVTKLYKNFCPTTFALPFIFERNVLQTPEMILEMSPFVRLLRSFHVPAIFPVEDKSA